MLERSHFPSSQDGVGPAAMTFMGPIPCGVQAVTPCATADLSCADLSCGVTREKEAATCLLRCTALKELGKHHVAGFVTLHTVPDGMLGGMGPVLKNEQCTRCACPC